MIDIIHGDSLDVLKSYPDNHFSALVTDPPASISLMGKTWDSDKGGRDQWIAWLQDILEETHRVLKPGSHGVIWALPRTSHYTAMAAELAGFEIRDVIHHIFGSGYPTGKHISKEIDKRENKGYKVKVTSGRGTNSTMYGSFGSGEEEGVYHDSLPESEEARWWFDWHTRLKPATEHWILVRKPLNGTATDNVLQFGTGALNIGASRVESFDGYEKAWDEPVSTNVGADGYVLLTMAQHTVDLSAYKPEGRFTANVVLSHHPDCIPETFTGYEEEYLPAECVPECPIRQINESQPKTKSRKSQRGKVQVFRQEGANQWTGESTERGHEDEGGVARYFNQFLYSPKVPPKEKRIYCPQCQEVYPGTKEFYIIHKPHGAVGHPTPKSIVLMKWLVTLITPPGGIVLDPFFGTGSTGVACQELGVSCVGIDAEADYLTIADRRIGEVA